MKLTQVLSNLHWFRNTGQSFWKKARKRHNKYWAHRNRRLTPSEMSQAELAEPNMPSVGMSNPYIKDPEPCILCKNDITVDFKELFPFSPLKNVIPNC